jgi:hypothetical protein
MVGYMVTPASARAIRADARWGADCGLAVARSTEPAAIDRYIAWLAALAHDRATCLFAVAPDVLGDAVATWARSAPLLPRIRALGYRAALVAQDGFLPEAVDWSAFDVLFIGGRPLVDRETTPQTEWKRLYAAEWKRQESGGYGAISEAKRRGKRVHVGRVNGEAFLRNVAGAGADSADGTGLVYAPDALWPLVTSWLDRLSSQPPMELLA